MEVMNNSFITSSRPSRRCKSITYRPLPNEAINEFGKWITQESFDELGKPNISTTEYAQQLQSSLFDKLNELCPLKTIKINSQDKPWINFELKSLKRRRMREWQKRGKTEKYKQVASEFETKYNKVAEKYINKKVDALKKTEPGKAFRILKTMGAKPGDNIDDGSFTLPSHQKDGLNSKQSAEKIADYFAKISKEYHPLNLELLPDRVKEKLKSISAPPIISEYECYRKIVATKKTKSGVPGELPSSFLKEFSVELSKPLTNLLNNIIKTCEWPEPWKIEFVTPIAKVPQPEDEDYLRPILLTPFFSKVMEKFVMMWLIECIGDKLDFRQYGGTKGNSITHYLIELLNFILYNQDSKEPTAVLACLVDFSKAFNRQDHNILITKLSDMGVPSWLLKLVMAFLTNRKMILRYKGEESSMRSLPGGGPQGTILGLFLFIILVNDLGFDNQENNLGEIMTCKTKVKKLNEIHLKYVDDMTIAEAISMKNQLDEVPLNKISLPDTYHERTGHVLLPENSKVHSMIQKTVQYAENNKMKINYKKTKLMVFNPGTARDIFPRFNFNGDELEVVEETKLLGLVIRNDLSWHPNTTYLIGRANRKLWTLRRLKKLGTKTSDLLEVYFKQIRSILELAVQLWQPGLTSFDRNRMERVQKSALSIILGRNYKSYNRALTSLKLETLFTRRGKLSKTFARKSQKNTKFSKWFEPNIKKVSTREAPKKIYEFDACARTMRFKKSPINYLTKLLNNNT